MTTRVPLPGSPVAEPTDRPGGVPAVDPVGTSVPRADGEAKVSGRVMFISDVSIPGMLHAALVRSPYAHARIRSIDVAGALAYPGVVATLTQDDIRDLPSPRYGHAIADHPIIALDKVRYAGEPVVAVIAVAERTAQMAAREVVVSYDELEALTTLEDALRPDAPRVHEASYQAGSFGGIYMGAGEGEEALPANVCHHTRLEWGDVDAAFGSAAKVAEATYTYPRVFGYAMEPYVAIADVRPGEITIHSGAQHPFLVRSDVATVFGLPLNKVRLIVPYIGGGFGTKSYTKIEPLVAACSRKAGRPVRLALSVDESMLTTRVAAARMELRTACDDAGRLVARAARLWFDGGAYAENGPHGAHLSPTHLIGPYRLPNVRVDAFLTYTNTAPSSSFRGFGSTQVTFAGESQIDELADQAGLDRVEFRARNLVAKGERMQRPDIRPLDGDAIGDLERAANAIGWGAPLEDVAGRGVALMVLAAGALPVSTSEVRVHGDGSVSVLSGTTELGQGSETVLCQIAARELGVPFTLVRVARADTALTPFERSTGASRSTTVQGRALIEACRDARRRLRGMAAGVLGVDEASLREVPGGIVNGDVFRPWGAIVNDYFGMPGSEAVGIGHVRKAGDFAQWPVFWELSAAGVEVQVDLETGRPSVLKLSTVADVGVAIHPEMLRGQDLGAAIQGLGPTLFEEMRYDGQQLANGSLLLYRVPRFSDLPADHVSILVEGRDGTGPYGAKGGGEGAISPMAPAVASAVEQATGVRLRSLPLTPEAIWRAMRPQAAGSAEG